MGQWRVPAACARLGRRCVDIEAEPEYVKIARKRVRLLGAGAGG